MPLNFKSNATALDSSYATWDDIGLTGNGLYAWGSNNYGQTARARRDFTAPNFAPQRIGTGSYISMSMGGNFSVAIKSDGTLWSVGQNNFGQLGLGNTTNATSPLQVGSGTNWSRVSAGMRFVIALKTDGTLWSWGYNVTGALGLGDATTTHRSSPVQIGTGTNWSKLSKHGTAWAAGAIKTDGTFWTWGQNNYGQLGLGDTTNRSSPVQVGALTNWSQFQITGTFGAALKTDGTLWTWGTNDYGQLGQGNTTNTSSPVQVGALTDWTDFSAGCGSSAGGIRSNGTLWTWGLNNWGQLGQSNAINRSSPVQVGALTSWSKIFQSQRGAFGDTGASFFIKTDGTLWFTGRDVAAGTNGTLARFTTSSNNYSSPVQLGPGTYWNAIYAHHTVDDVGGDTQTSASVLASYTPPFASP